MKVHRVHYALFIIFLLPLLSHSCSTIVAGREATTTGAVIVSHSNDGDGDVAGNLKKVPPSSYTLPSNRSVSRGSIPQVAETVGYFTEGYAIMNEYQVSTCERSSTHASEASISSSFSFLNLLRVLCRWLWGNPHVSGSTHPEGGVY